MRVIRHNHIPEKREIAWPSQFAQCPENQVAFGIRKIPGAALHVKRNKENSVKLLDAP